MVFEKDVLLFKKTYMLSNNISDMGGFIGMGSLFDGVLQTISDWNPKAEYSTESKYRNDLLAFLR